MERDAGAAARSLFDDDVTSAQRADLYDELIPIYTRGLDAMFDVAAPSPDREDDLDEFRLSIGQNIKEMTAASPDLHNGVEPSFFDGLDTDRIVESDQRYAQEFGVGPCGLGTLPADVPPGEVSADDVDVLRTTCAHFESRIAASLPSADDDTQFLHVLHSAVLTADHDVGALRNNDLERTVKKSLHDFEDALLGDDRGKSNTQMLMQYRDQMAAVKALLHRYGVDSGCGLDFTSAGFTTAPAAT